MSFLKKLACTGLLVSSTAVPVHAGDPVVVFAASSLSNVVSELARAFEKQADQKVVVSFAASSVLARQIKDGAPAQIFISANTAWMNDVIDAGAISGTSRTVVAGNRLALAGAAGVSYPAVVDGEISAHYPLVSVAPDLRFAIGNPEHVPAGIYARQALLGLGLWQGIHERLIPMPSVRSVVANIDRGEVAGGFIYASDIGFSEKIHLIGLFPKASHSPIQYVAGIVTEERSAEAEAFFLFLTSSEAIRLFREFGFLPPPSGSDSITP